MNLNSLEGTSFFCRIRIDVFYKNPVKEGEFGKIWALFWG